MLHIIYNAVYSLYTSRVDLKNVIKRVVPVPHTELIVDLKSVFVQNPSSPIGNWVKSMFSGRNR